MRCSLVALPWEPSAACPRSVCGQAQGPSRTHHLESGATGGGGGHQRIPSGEPNTSTVALSAPRAARSGFGFFGHAAVGTKRTVLARSASCTRDVAAGVTAKRSHSGQEQSKRYCHKGRGVVTVPSCMEG